MDRPGSTAVLRVGVGVVIADDRRTVLVCLRRQTDYYGGYWEFPGGKCEALESPAECVKRELREELGIDVAVLAPLQIIHHHYADRNRSVELHPWTCRMLAGEPRAIEVAEFRWCRPDELRQLRFLPANGPLIDAIAAQLRPET